MRRTGKCGTQRYGGLLTSGLKTVQHRQPSQSSASRTVPRQLAASHGYERGQAHFFEVTFGHANRFQLMLHAELEGCLKTRSTTLGRWKGSCRLCQVSFMYITVHTLWSLHQWTPGQMSALDQRLMPFGIGVGRFPSAASDSRVRGFKHHIIYYRLPPGNVIRMHGQISFMSPYFVLRPCFPFIAAMSI